MDWRETINKGKDQVLRGGFDIGPSTSFFAINSNSVMVQDAISSGESKIRVLCEFASKSGFG